jgi:hypothetical protein
MIAGRGRLDISSAPLYSLAERLVAECRQIKGLVNSRLVAEKDKQALGLLDAISSRNVVDLQVNEYKPTIRRLRRRLQKEGMSEWSPQRVHLRFFEILFAVADLYEWLLNDAASFYRMPPDGPLHAGLEERRRWASAREAAERGSAEIKPPPVSATPESWAEDAAARFEGLKHAGRLAFVLMEVTGRDLLEAEGEPGVLALAASSIPGQGPDAPAEAAIIGRDRLLAVTPRGTLVAAGWADRWRPLLSALLKKHPLFGEIIEQKRKPGLGELRAGVADVSDCPSARDALARAESALEAARGELGPVAVWQSGEVMAFADYVARFARPLR